MTKKRKKQISYDKLTNKVLKEIRKQIEAKATADCEAA